MKRARPTRPKVRISHYAHGQFRGVHLSSRRSLRLTTYATATACLHAFFMVIAFPCSWIEISLLGILSTHRNYHTLVDLHPPLGSRPTPTLLSERQRTVFDQQSCGMLAAWHRSAHISLFHPQGKARLKVWPFLPLHGIPPEKERGP
ncbi:hypothetical protein EJ04DRAFT_354472 [Polyplosphaeria fusca]|uniref:Uncharacterized protein n=1 Tax=Polyplosphaeria fusca TaxID=682080 RepID=A0A9P4R9G8_9PLEO|nr:hypothetical protein EJ04DRAFT_354472 [Polyplosphaeria fusca]